MWAVCLAVLAALGATASAQDPAASPAGVLKPQRLAMTNNRTAYYQLTEGEPKGTAVRGEEDRPAAAAAAACSRARRLHAHVPRPSRPCSTRTTGHAAFSTAAAAACSRARRRLLRGSLRLTLAAMLLPVPQVIVHGCGPGARAYFPQHPVDCPECFPYPEYIAQTKLALASGYHALVLQARMLLHHSSTVAAQGGGGCASHAAPRLQQAALCRPWRHSCCRLPCLQSTNEGSGCWSSSAGKEGYIDDRPHVRAACLLACLLASHACRAAASLQRWSWVAAAKRRAAAPRCTPALACCPPTCAPICLPLTTTPQVVNAVVDFLRLANATDLPVYYQVGGGGGRSAWAGGLLPACHPSQPRRPPTLPPAARLQGYSSGGTMLLKLPGYLLESGRGGELRVDGVVSVDAAPRGGFGAEGRPGRLKAGLRDFPPVLYVAMQARARGAGLCCSDVRVGRWRGSRCMRAPRLARLRLLPTLLAPANQAGRPAPPASRCAAGRRRPRARPRPDPVPAQQQRARGPDHGGLEAGEGWAAALCRQGSQERWAAAACANMLAPTTPPPCPALAPPQKPPSLITPTFFSDRVPGLAPDQSAALVEALKAGGQLTPEGAQTGASAFDAAVQQVRAEAGRVCRPGACCWV